VPVDISGNRNGAVPEQVHDRLDMDARLEDIIEFLGAASRNPPWL
jgi:hypothetical protein